VYRSNKYVHIKTKTTRLISGHEIHRRTLSTIDYSIKVRRTNSARIIQCTTIFLDCAMNSEERWHCLSLYAPKLLRYCHDLLTVPPVWVNFLLGVSARRVR
jgi:hypothetical protein